MFSSCADAVRRLGGKRAARRRPGAEQRRSSLDLYELVMELEDRYGISISEQQAAQIETVGDAVSFVLEHAPA